MRNRNIVRAEIGGDNKSYTIWIKAGLALGIKFGK